MARVTYTDLIDGATLEAETVADYFYSPTGDSLSVINGRLSDTNLLFGGDKLDETHIQREALSTGGMVAGTRNLDYFGGTNDKIASLFRGVVDAEQAGKSRFVAIPGASVQFYLPYNAYVLLTWHIHWVNDSHPDDDTSFPPGGSHMRLFVNDEPSDGGYRPNTIGGRDLDSPQVRGVGHTMYKNSGLPSSNADAFLRDRYKGRYWCGHTWIANLGKGWHSASIRLCSHQDVKQTRVRARSMKYIAFKRGDT